MAPLIKKYSWLTSNTLAILTVATSSETNHYWESNQ